jgi:predicted NUDIX family NTP pyrophosphohydrolase
VPKLSAGLLPFRVRSAWLECLLVHPGGPFWARKDAGAWSIAKGEYEPGDDPWETAKREFNEEVGMTAPDGEPIALGQIKQPSGKLITAFALRADFEVGEVVSNTFTLEWPRGSGRVQEFPEVDAARWMPLNEARRAIIAGQLGFLDRLLETCQDQTDRSFRRTT